MFVGSQVSVTSTAAALWNSVNAGSYADPIPVIAKNQDPAYSVWLGGASVATSGQNVGYELEAGNVINLNVWGNDVIYAVSNGSVRVDVLIGHQ